MNMQNTKSMTYTTENRTKAYEGQALNMVEEYTECPWKRVLT